MSAAKTKTPDKGKQSIRVHQRKSMCRICDHQRKVLKGLGLGKIGTVRLLEDTPSIRGMLHKVHHLVTFETYP